MKKGRFTCLLVVSITSVSLLFAGDPARIGTAAGTQVLVPVGARGLAMGGADLAYTRGLDAIHWNPAGFAVMEDNAAGLFSTMSFFNDIRLNYFAAGFKSPKLRGSLGVSIKAFDFGDIPITTMEDMDGASGKTFSPTFATIGLTYGGNLSDRINVGITTKIIYESIPRAVASALAFDFGVQYRDLGGISGLGVGITVRNIGTNMEYTGSGLLTQARDVGSPYDDFRSRQAASDQLPSNIELGLSYRASAGGNNYMMASGIFQNNNFGDDALRLGGEFALNNMIFLRGGYNYVMFSESTEEEVASPEAEDLLYTFTVGAGLNYTIAGMDLTFDYAYRDSRYFNGNNVFAIRMGF